jgi:hypothetical protein
MKSTLNFQMLLPLKQIFPKFWVWLDNFSLTFNKIIRQFSTQPFLLHHKGNNQRSRSRHSSLAVHKDVCFFEMLTNVFAGCLELWEYIGSVAVC